MTLSIELPNFNPLEQSKYSIYLDLNNLYGEGMIYHLSTREFK